MCECLLRRLAQLWMKLLAEDESNLMATVGLAEFRWVARRVQVYASVFTCARRVCVQDSYTPDTTHWPWKLAHVRRLWFQDELECPLGKRSAGVGATGARVGAVGTTAGHDH